MSTALPRPEPVAVRRYTLRQATAAEGIAWARNGMALFMSRPVAFLAMFAVYISAGVILSAVPGIGAAVVMASAPLLGLGFMVAGDAALRNAPVHPGQFLTPLSTDGTRRRTLLLLCAVYSVAAALALLLADSLDGGAFDRLEAALTTNPPQREVATQIMQEPGFAWAWLLRLATLAALAVPFWHAPALVHWAGQGVGQAMVTSSLAIWRNRAAYLAFAAVWVAGIAMASLLVTLLSALLTGSTRGASFVALISSFVFGAAFFAAQIHTFRGTFAPVDAEPAPAAAG